MGHTSTPPSDTILAAALRAGDESTFRRLLDTWSPSMLRLARSFVASPQAAEEVVQETWLAVIQGVGRFEGRSSLKTWVFRILVNTAKQHGRRESRTLPFSSLLPEDEGPSVDPSRFQGPTDPDPGHWVPGRSPQPWTHPETAALQAETRAVLGAALAALPDRHRLVVTLRDVEGYSSDEVCTMLGISVGNQRVILHRARGAIRARLEAYFADRVPAARRVRSS